MKGRLNNEIVIIGLIVLVSLSVQGCDRRQAAIAKVKKLGGTVEIDKEQPESVALTISLMDCDVKDSELGFLKDLSGLEALDLRNTKINGEGLIHLRGVTSLKKLLLHYCPITDAGARQIKELSSLTELDVGHSLISDTGLGYIGEIKLCKRIGYSIKRIKTVSLSFE